ncbi:MAG: glycine cleavage system aminomethyltransferase GcvT [Christensenellales bacterium]|jgi:aminomethyltransferase
MALKTPLYETHEKLGGKIVEFGGYLLPVNYQKGIIFEHNAVRCGVGLFDVSHMGEILISGKEAAAALRRLVTNKVSTIKVGQCRYTLMCYPDGGIVDDLLIYKFSDEEYFLIVNAANKDKDFAWITENISGDAVATDLSDKIGQIAVQGPLAEKVMAKTADMTLIPKKRYYFARDVVVFGKKCLVSTTGYTGEDGYEIYCDAADTAEIYEKLMEAGSEIGIEPCGLGARDTLRFESSMPLYGHELSAEIKANEVGLDMFIKSDEEFIGREAILNNPPAYCRRGLKLVDRGIAREHADVYGEDGQKIGFTTSGMPCPTVGGAYAMARIKADYAFDRVFIDVRGKMLAAEFVTMPFYKKA